MKRQNQGSKFMLFILTWAIVFMMLMMFILGVISVFIPIDLDGVLMSPWAIVVNQLGIFILPLAMWTTAKGEQMWASIPKNPLGGKNILILVALSILLQPLMMTLSGVSSLFFNNDVAELMYSFQQHPFWLQILAIAVTPAICEELVFRGYLQSKYRAHTIKQAAFINGLFFAFMHMNFQQFAYTFVLGVIFAYMVHYTRSIWAGILPHFIVNASQVALSRVVLAMEEPVAEEVYLAGLSVEMQGLLYIAGLALVLMPVVVILFRALIKHNRERAPEWAGWDNAAPLPETVNTMPEWASFTGDASAGPPVMPGAPNMPDMPEPMPGAPEPELEEKPWSSLFDPVALWVIVVYALFMAFITWVT